MTMPEDPGSQSPGYPPSGQQGYPPAGPPPDYSGAQQPPAGPPPGPPSASYGPGQPGYQEPPRRRSRSGLIAIVVLVVLVVAIVGGLAFFRDRISGDVTSLQVGDCIDEPSETSSITQVQHQPCADPHDGEVFLLITDPAATDAAYPDTSHFTQIAASQCLPAASAYIGTPIERQTELDVGYFYPTASSWSTSDRGITCYVYKTDGSKLVGSLHGATPSSTP